MYPEFIIKFFFFVCVLKNSSSSYLDYLPLSQHLWVPCHNHNISLNHLNLLVPCHYVWDVKFQMSKKKKVTNMRTRKHQVMTCKRTRHSGINTTIITTQLYVIIIQRTTILPIITRIGGKVNKHSTLATAMKEQQVSKYFLFKLFNIKVKI